MGHPAEVHKIACGVEANRRQRYSRALGGAAQHHAGAGTTKVGNSHASRSDPSAFWYLVKLKAAPTSSRQATVAQQLGDRSIGGIGNTGGAQVLEGTGAFNTPRCRALKLLCDCSYRRDARKLLAQVIIFLVSTNFSPECVNCRQGVSAHNVLWYPLSPVKIRFRFLRTAVRTVVCRGDVCIKRTSIEQPTGRMSRK